MNDLQRSAIIDDAGKYRYALGRRWARGGKLAAFIMLNPSTADASQDDPTIRRCMSFAKRLGCNGLVVGNLFAYRATKPTVLAKARHPIGDKNDDHLLRMTRRAHITICGWGAQNFALPRVKEVMKLLKRRSLFCLGKTKHGHPRHPLYLRKDARLEPFLTK